MVGTTLGHYEILARLGSGAMGDVYRALDTTLKREVAIKVLPEEFISDEDRVIRLEREAHLLASLNHPHIATIYSLEEAAGSRFLVLELVNGESLAQTLATGPLPVEKALDVCKQIATALEAAHGEGIIHRDLKPANVVLTRDGMAKVLDFGIAKVVDAGEDATDTEAGTKLTMAGSLIGTVPYMSPEQVRGHPADARSDIWSLGCVMYELLTAQAAFDRETMADTLSAILEHEPDWESLPPSTPESVRTLLRRCLEKDSRRRLQSAADARIELEDATATIARGPGDTRRSTLSKKAATAAIWSRRTTIRVAATLALGLTLVSAGLYLYSAVGPSAPAERIPIAVVPLLNQTGDPQFEGYRLALTHSLILNLTGSPTINVLPYERLREILQGFEAEQKDISSTEVVRAIQTHSNARLVVVPRLYAAEDSWRLEVTFRNPQTGLTLDTLEVVRPFSESAENTAYSLLAPLADAIEEYFGVLGGAEAYAGRPPSSRPRTLIAAADFEEGINALAMGEYGRALSALERLVDQDPEFALAHAQMGRIYGTLGYDAEALEHSENAAMLVTQETPTVDAYSIEANLAERRYEFSTAEQKYLELIQLYPGDPTWYGALGALYQGQDRHQDAIRTYLQAIDADPHYTQAYLELGRAYARLSDYSYAEQYAQAALDTYRGLGNQAGEAHALLALGDMLRATGESEKARERNEAALKIFQNLGHTFGMARAYKYLGDVAHAESRLDEALVFYQDSLAGSGERRDIRGVATVLHNLGATHEAQGNRLQAMDYFRQSLDVAERYRDEYGRATTLTNLASLLVEFGPSPERGLKDAQAAVALFRELGDQGWEAFARAVIGIYHRNTGHHEEALSDLQQSLAVMRSIDSKADITFIRYQIGRCHFLQDQYERASSLLREVLAEFEGLNDGRWAAATEIVLARIDGRLGDGESASASLAGLLEVIEENQYGDLLPEAYTALGELHQRAGNREEARDYFGRAAALWTGEAPDAASVEATSHLSLLLADAGDFPQAFLDAEASLEQAETMQRARLQAMVRLNLARLHFKRKDYEQTLQALAEIPSEGEVKIEPELLAQRHFLGGQAFEALGRMAESQNAYQRAREIVYRIRQEEIAEGHRGSFIDRADMQLLLR